MKEKRTDQMRVKMMMEAASAMQEYLHLRPSEYGGTTREARFARDGLRSRVYEFCDAGTNLGQAFRHVNPRMDLRPVDRMRHDLAHNYPEVTAEMVWAFARDEVPLVVRKFSSCRFPKE